MLMYSVIKVSIINSQYSFKIVKSFIIPHDIGFNKLSLDILPNIITQQYLNCTYHCNDFPYTCKLVSYNKHNYSWTYSVVDGSVCTCEKNYDFTTFDEMIQEERKLNNCVDNIDSIIRNSIDIGLINEGDEIIMKCNTNTLPLTSYIQEMFN